MEATATEEPVLKLPKPGVETVKVAVTVALSISLTTMLTRFSGVFSFSSCGRHTFCAGDWSSDVCSADLLLPATERAPSLTLVAIVKFAFTSAAGVKTTPANNVFTSRSEERRVGKQVPAL